MEKESVTLEKLNILLDEMSDAISSIKQDEIFCGKDMIDREYCVGRARRLNRELSALMKFFDKVSVIPDTE